MAGEGEPRTVWRQPTGDAGPGAARALASSRERRRDERRSDQKPILPSGGGLPPNGRSLLFWLAASFLLLWVWQEAFQYLAYRTLPYSEFKRYLAAGEISEVAIKDATIEGRAIPAPAAAPQAPGAPAEPSAAPATPAPPAAEKTGPTAPAVPGLPGLPGLLPPTSSEGPPTEPFLFRTVRVEDPGLVDELVAQHVRFVGVHPGFLTQFLISWALPIALLAGAWVLLSRRFATGSGVMSFGKSRARLVADKDTGVRFEDVAGCDEAKAELVEVVDFLRDPERYRALGARIPKGVLLVGPPGTGKTLIARAVAGEAHVPFFSLSGSDFVEMFVGVGAARVRDLFEQAQKQAPCIVFIDELDAIGRQRGVQMGMVNDEREQTLNQLLVEMDGFEANAGVILLAATNRPDVLDRALLRPGRFDRQVVVDAPDLEGREAILRVHVRGKPIAADADLGRIAQATPGFSGADLANVVNEAALLAARLGEHEIAQKHLEEAVEKVVAGPERRSRRLREEEKRRVAFHEVGHAMVAEFCEHADPVHKISIVPRGRAALGYTLQLPTGDQFVLSRSALLDRVRGLLGGRAAEELAFGEVSTGAQNDLERATAMVRQMLTMYGMGEAVGLMHAARPREGAFAGAEGGLQRDCAEETAREIDEEVRRMLDEAYADALGILREHREALDAAASELLRRETLDADTFRRLIGLPPAPA